MLLGNTTMRENAPKVIIQLMVDIITVAMTMSTIAKERISSAHDIMLL